MKVYVVIAYYTGEFIGVYGSRKQAQAEAERCSRASESDEVVYVKEEEISND